MKKIYRIDALDCPNCAIKIEKNVRKMTGIRDVNVDFVQKKLYIEYENEQMEDDVRKLVKGLEPDIEMKEIVKQSPHEQHHQHVHYQHTQEHEHSFAHEDLALSDADKLYIDGLDCANCASKIEDHVKAMDGVNDAHLNFSTGVLFINIDTAYDKKSVLDQIVKEVVKIESGIRITSEKKQMTAATSRLFAWKENYRLYIGVFIFVVALFLEKESYAFWVFLLAYLVVGGKVVYTAIKNLMRKEVFDENFLMSVATIGAFCTQSYKEAVAVMIFYEIGEMFQSFAVKRSRNSISSLMNIRADYANVIRNQEELKVDPEDVGIDEIIVIKPGERIPLDGIVVEGTSSLDTSALTGESIPREVSVNDEVLAGVVNVNGMIKLKVTKEFGESTVARILELVENASSKKAPMEKFITRFARIYTPIVVVLAILVAIVPLLFFEPSQFQVWLYRALTFLVVSCPCALVISVPLGMFAGIGAAGKQGVLIKGGNYLEALKDINTVVFDKTGTLTKGVFAVQTIVPVNMSKQDLLTLGAYGEYYSNHPIAASIRNAYQSEIEKDYLRSYEEIAGNGIRVFYKDKELLAGNDKLMQAYQISYRKAEEIGTIIHIAYDHAYAGYLVIADELKETSKQAIQDLKKSGVHKCVMLSGDRQEVGDYVASQLNLDEVHMQLLPNEKVDIVEQMIANQDKGKLAFVGDGINDAPVLARADIGIAMGGIGSDAAIEAADVVLMKDDPRAITTAMRIAGRTNRIIWQNIVFSLSVKVIVLILTVVGISNMWMGVFADVGVTLLAVLNAMRALKDQAVA